MGMGSGFYRSGIKSGDRKRKDTKAIMRLIRNLDMGYMNGGMDGLTRETLARILGMVMGSSIRMDVCFLKGIGSMARRKCKIKNNSHQPCQRLQISKRIIAEGMGLEGVQWVLQPIEARRSMPMRKLCAKKEFSHLVIAIHLFSRKAGKVLEIAYFDQWT